MWYKRLPEVQKVLQITWPTRTSSWQPCRNDNSFGAKIQSLRSFYFLFSYSNCIHSWCQFSVCSKCSSLIKLIRFYLFSSLEENYEKRYCHEIFAKAYPTRNNFVMRYNIKLYKFWAPKLAILFRMWHSC